MRKRNFSFCLDKLMWFLIYTAPLLIVLFSAFATPLGDIITSVNSSPFVQDFGTTAIYTALDNFFGVNGVLPFLDGPTGVAILSYMTYFINVLIVHLAVDFLVFIPRLGHKLLDKVCGGSNE